MKKRLWIIAFIVLLITCISITGTYALFEADASAEQEFDIGRWVIKVNNNDISLAHTITLNDFTYSTSTHTQNGYFAPGRSASFDVVVDASDTDVAVEYSFDIDDSALDDHPNISFNIVNTDTNESISGTTYSGIIGLNSQNRTVTLSITLVWSNNSQYDENDTDLIGEELEFLINANFKQYLGE